MLNKLCLSLMVFTCGWVLMALEMIGPRFLQSVFGSGIHVWGSIISTFLLALAVGYWFGGQVSKKWAGPVCLATIGLCVALWINLILALNEPVNDWLFDIGVDSLKLREKWPALASAFIFYFVPSALLGMVSPIAVRMASSQLDRVGESAGTLYAISTVGSFLGCIVTAFYFIGIGTIDRILTGHAIALTVVSMLIILANMRTAQ